jgi:TRAP-type C4-dicarboxylate transport system substrate-binding protein
MPILVAFKYYDIATDVTDLNFSHIVSMNIVNEAWFQAQTPEVQEAIRAAGRAAEQAVFDWGVENVERTNAAWRDNGGTIHTLPAEEEAAMLDRFREIGAEIVAADPAVAEEYDRLIAVLEANAQ